MKKFFGIIICCLGVFFASSHVFAQQETANCQVFEVSADGGSVNDIQTLLDQCSSNTVGIKPNSNSAGNGTTAFKERVNELAGGLLKYGAVFAILMFVFSGILYTTSYGVEERMSRAKSTAIYTAVGFFLILAAYSLVNGLLYIIYSVAK